MPTHLPSIPVNKCPPGKTQEVVGDLHHPGPARERFETAIIQALGQSLPRGFEPRLQIAVRALRRVSGYGTDSARVASVALCDMEAIPLGDYFDLRENESSEPPKASEQNPQRADPSLQAQIVPNN
ncbi:MAG: hypothetical protein JWO08_4724 [Verrucomicrobiaceae bacterium]|nr:hypothetical protein [Verrucomicrobiaceae bacterium]